MITDSRGADGIAAGLFFAAPAGEQRGRRQRAPAAGRRVT